MPVLKLVLFYLSWHYTKAFVDIYNMMRNISWFLWNFFSIPLLSQTLFAPWKRMGEKYKGGLDFKSFFESFITGFFMRTIGFFMRTFVILIGLFSICLSFFISIIWVVIWIIAPFIIAIVIILSLGAFLGFRSL